MAIDRALQLCREADDSPPTLRLYWWDVPTVTLGKFQDADRIDLALCRREGIAVVRRATGGRGVLHDDEVTYCVVASEQDGVPRGTSASYAHLGAGIVEAYRLLGVDTAVTSRSRGRSGSSACYLQTTQADVSAGSAKISGSAQVWTGTTCMQHGSFTRSRDLSREQAVFALTQAETDELRSGAVTLGECGVDVGDRQAIVDAVIQGFGDALGLVLEPGELTETERDTANRLLDAGEIRLTDR
jgi:lipoate-protein ligase A